MPRPYSPAPLSLAQPIQGYYIINLLHEPLRILEREEKTDFTKEESQPITNWTVQKKPLHRKNTYQSHQIKRFTGKYSNPMHQLHAFTGKYPKPMYQLHVFTGKCPKQMHQLHVFTGKYPKQMHQLHVFTGKYPEPMHQLHVFTGKYPKPMHQLHVFTGKYPERGHQIPLLPVRGLNLSTHFAIRPISTPHQTTSMPLLTV